MGSRLGHGQHDVKAQESFGRCWPHGVIYLRCPFTVLFSQDTLLIFMKHHKVSLDFGWISMGQQSRWDGYRLKWLFTVASSCVKKQQSNVLTKEWNYDKHEGKKHASTLYQASALNCRIYFIFIFFYYCELNLQVTEWGMRLPTFI